MKRQLTFGSVKKVINTMNNPEATYAPDQVAQVLAPTSTTAAGAKHKLYLPKKHAQMNGQPGVQI